MGAESEQLEVTIPQAMRLLGCGRQRVVRYCEDGRLRYRTEGGRNGARVLIERASIKAFLDAQYEAQRAVNGQSGRREPSEASRASGLRMARQVSGK